MLQDFIWIIISRLINIFGTRTRYTYYRLWYIWYFYINRLRNLSVEYIQSSRCSLNSRAFSFNVKARISHPCRHRRARNRKCADANVTCYFGLTRIKGVFPKSTISGRTRSDASASARARVSQEYLRGNSCSVHSIDMEPPRFLGAKKCTKKRLPCLALRNI